MYNGLKQHLHLQCIKTIKQWCSQKNNMYLSIIFEPKISMKQQIVKVNKFYVASMKSKPTLFLTMLLIFLFFSSPQPSMWKLFSLFIFISYQLHRHS
jgi:hypothetical protein